MATGAALDEEPSDAEVAPRPARHHSRDAITVAVITAIALAIRLPRFTESFFGDELFTLKFATASTLSGVLHGVNSDQEITPPLFFFVAWFAQKLGDPFIWLRVPSLVAGVATVPLVYVLGVRTVGRGAAVLGAGLFALSPFAMFYATEARAYALVTFVVVLSTLVLLHAIERNTWPWWSVYALVVAAAMYTHYSCVFVLAAQTVWAVVVHRDRVGRLAIATLGAALLFVPWVPGFMADRDAPAEKVIGLLAPFGWSTARDAVLRFAAGDPFAHLTGSLWHVSFALLGLAVVVGLVGLFSRIAAHRPPRPSAARVLIVVLAIAAPVGSALYSSVGDSVFIARDLITSLPFLALALAALLVALPRSAARVAIGLALVGLAFGAVASLRPDARRPASADAAAYVNANARPGDVVLELQAVNVVDTTAVRVHLDPRLPYFGMAKPSTAEASKAARASKGRIFFVRSDVGKWRDLDAPLPPGRYRNAGERTWQGLQPLTVVVYEPTRK